MWAVCVGGPPRLDVSTDVVRAYGYKKLTLEARQQFEDTGDKKLLKDITESVSTLNINIASIDMST